MKKYIKIIALLLSVIVCLGLFTGCGKKQKAKEDPKETEKEKVEEELPSSETLGLYAFGKSIVDADGQPTDYLFDEEGNVVDAEGKIIIATDNIVPFTCVDIIKYDLKDFRVEISGTRIQREPVEVSQDANGEPNPIIADAADTDEFATKPQDFEFVINVSPEDAINSALRFESKDAGMISFDPEKNKDYIYEYGQETVKSDDVIWLQADKNNEIHLVATVSFGGTCNIVVSNIIGAEVDTVIIIVDVKELASEPAGTSVGNRNSSDKDNNKNGTTTDKNQNNNGTNQNGNTNNPNGNNTNTNQNGNNGNNGNNTNQTGNNGTGNNSSAPQAVADDGHIHQFKEKVIEATARTQGYTLYTCEICGYSYRSNYTARTSHTHEYEITVVAPTYTTKGYTRHTCKICGDSYTDSETDMLVCNHPNSVDTVIKPSCTEGGYTQHVCQNCKKTWKDSATSATGHKWGNWETITEPTETATGLKGRKCTVCGAQDPQTQTIPVKQHVHSMKQIPGVEPTCTTDGTKAYYQCTSCNKMYLDANGNSEITNQSVLVLPKAHKLTYINPVAANCKNEGNIGYYKCDSCKKLFSDSGGTKEITAESTVIAKTTTHTYGGWTVTKPATCQAEGEQVRTCSVCQAKETQTIPVSNQHAFGSWTTVDPTCSTPGSRTRTCSVCGTEETQSIPATGQHSFGDWSTKAPSCTEPGMKSRSCSVCGYLETQAIPATGHSPNLETVEGSPATCTASGVTNLVCPICHQTVRTIASSTIPHNFVPGTPVQATCTEGGYTPYTCSVCGTTENRDQTPALGHDYQVSSVVDPTETSGGYTVYECTRCHDSYTGNETPPLPPPPPQPSEVVSQSVNTPSSDSIVPPENPTTNPDTVSE